MSLRARIEAVIYAAEEPVTLAQLSALFADEALGERAARQALARGAAGSGEGSGQGEALSEDARFESAEDAAADHADAPASDSDIEQAIEHPEQVSATGPDGFAGEAEAEAAPGPGGKTGEGASARADDARRAARQREREAREEIRRALDALIAEYDGSDRGMEIREIAGGYRVSTRPEYHDAVRGFVKSLKPAMKLSLQALETLAVIAYKQPVTAPEVSDIRGVDSGGVLGSLISRKLVTTAGRKQVIGRPILYKTTKEFLLRFGLKDLAELPSMEEFEKMAGELVESEPAGPDGAGAAGQTEPARQLDLEGAFERQDVQADAADEKEASTMQTEEPAGREVSGREDEMVSGFEPVLEPVEEPATAAEVQVAPELAEALEEEELAANARANVQVDDESEGCSDLPGVTRDTAGKVNIDSVAHPHPPGFEDEGY